MENSGASRKKIFSSLLEDDLLPNKFGGDITLTRSQNSSSMKIDWVHNSTQKIIFERDQKSLQYIAGYM